MNYKQAIKKLTEYDCMISRAGNYDLSGEIAGMLLELSEEQGWNAFKVYDDVIFAGWNSPENTQRMAKLDYPKYLRAKILLDAGIISERAFAHWLEVRTLQQNNLEAFYSGSEKE